jgi:hypothetical protein
MALFGRRCLPHRSSLSHFLVDEELASALRAIITYLKHFALPAEVALLPLDGQDGDAAVIVQLIHPQRG